MATWGFGRRFAALIAVVSWTALIAQYVLLIAVTVQDIGLWLGTLRYFSFFTILCNLLVALTTTYALFDSQSNAARFFTGTRMRGGVALCIGIVSMIYYTLLASTWAPQGVQWVVDITLHYVVPIFYLAWWVTYGRTGELVWSDPLRWLAFPGIYFGWCLLRGYWLHEYPYPFIDVDALGFAIVLRNALGIALLFLFGGFVLVALDRFAPRAR
jgi:hypothetical protein